MIDTSVGFARTVVRADEHQSTRGLRRTMHMTTHRDPGGKVQERHQFIDRILQPGETRFDVSDLSQRHVTEATIRSLPPMPCCPSIVESEGATK